MFEIHVKELVFAQAAKYMLIAKNDVETVSCRIVRKEVMCVLC